MSTNLTNIAKLDIQPPVGHLPARSQLLRERRPKLAGSQSNAISPQLVWYTLVRWWKVALPIGLACAAAAAAVVCVTFQPSYLASVWIQIYEKPQYLLFGDRTDQSTSQLFVATQMQLLTSPMVMYGTDDIGPQGVVDELLNGKLVGWSGSDVPDLDSGDRSDRTFLGDWVSRGVSVSRVGKASELYTVSFSSVSPPFATAVANAVTQNYLALLRDQNKKRNSEILQRLNKTNTDRVADLEVDLEALDELAKGLPGRAGVMGRPEADSPATDALAGVQASLTTAEVEVELLKVDVQMLQEGPATPAADPTAPTAASVEILSHPSVLEKFEELSKRKAILQGIEQASVQGKDDPSLLRVQDEIARLEREIEEEIRVRVEQDKSRKLAVAQAELEKKQLAVQFLKTRQEDLLKQAQEVSSESLDLELKVSQVDRKQEWIGRIDERIQALQIEHGALDAVILWRLADEPSRPEQLYPTKQLAMAVPAGLAIPFALFLVWELLARRVFSSDRLEKDLELTVLGEIARLPKRRFKGSAKSGGQFNRSLQLYRESFDALSTNLALALDLPQTRVLAVASAVNSEGKTSVAAELARRLAENMHVKVLLIDADMRSPDIHRLFQIPADPGLTGVLAHEASLEQAVVTTWSDHLHLLPAGHLSGSPVALMGNGNLKALMAQVLADYRFVVIDTPPVLAASESLMLSSVADVTLLCVMCEVSRADQVQRAYKRLTLSGSLNVGLVFNGVPSHQYQSRYGKYPYPTS